MTDAGLLFDVLVLLLAAVVEASLQMAGLVLASAGIDDDKVKTSLNTYHRKRYGKGHPKPDGSGVSER